MEKYKITYFNNKLQRIVDETFEGVNAYEKAVEWGKLNLVNFYYDLIRRV